MMSTISPCIRRGHALLGGAAQAAQGGSFWSGFAASGFTSGIGNGWIHQMGGNDPLLHTLIAAGLAGTISKLTGGSFYYGALNSGEEWAYNAEKGNWGQYWTRFKTWAEGNVSWHSTLDFSMPFPNPFSKTLPGSRGQYSSWIPIAVHLDVDVTLSGGSLQLGFGSGIPTFLQWFEPLRDMGLGGSTGLDVYLKGDRNDYTNFKLSGSGGDEFGGNLSLGFDNLKLKTVDATVGFGFGLGVTGTIPVNNMTKNWTWPWLKGNH
jgi:hypothetical protein